MRTCNLTRGIVAENSTHTYTSLTGERKELVVLGKPLSQKRERFAQLVAFGALPVDALIEAYDRPRGDEVYRRAHMAEAAAIMLDTDVRIRIQELRRPIRRKLIKKWEYDLNKAHEDCQTAWDLAYANGDPKAMLKCVELRSKLSKILSDEVNVHHTHGLLDKETTEVLLAMKEQAARKKSHAKVIEGEVVENKGELIQATPNAPFYG